MKKLVLFIFVTLAITFSGCSTYYATASKQKIPEITQKRIPVKVEVTQKDWSIVSKVPDETVKIYANVMVDRNLLFLRDENARDTLHIDIVHSNDNGALEMSGAIITGASFFIIPGRATSDVTITITLNEFSTEYKGEIGVAQGIAKSALIDKEKYTVSNADNVLNVLIANALNQFATAYLKQ